MNSMPNNNQLADRVENLVKTLTEQLAGDPKHQIIYNTVRTLLIPLLGGDPVDNFVNYIKENPEQAEQKFIEIMHFVADIFNYEVLLKKRSA